MKHCGWIAGLVVLVCLASAGCSLGKRKAVMPLSTSSEEASRLYSEGMGLLEVYRVDEARARFEQAVELDPDFALAHLALAETAPTFAGTLGSLRKATALKDGVSEGERRMILAFEAGTRGDPVMQSAHYQALVSLYPDDKAASARYGAFLISTGQNQRALSNLDRAVALDPEYARPYLLMGTAHRGRGEFQLAREAVDRYLGLMPDEPAAHVALAELLMKEGRFEESNLSYEKALALDSRCIPARVGMGNNSIFMGDLEQAREIFGNMDDAASNDADRLLGPLWLAASYVHEGRHDEALAELQRRHVLAEQTKDAVLISEGLSLMGDVLLDDGRFDDALARYASAFDVIKHGGLPFAVTGPAGWEYAYRKTRVALARGDMRTALAELRGYLKQAGIRKGRHWSSHQLELKGLVALLKGDLDNATMLLPRANNDNPRIVYFGALARQRAGDDEGAGELLRRVADFNEIDLEYAFVRSPARRMLEEL